MAVKGSVWGIDIGQCALKAMRCRADEDGDKIVVEAFDYIEYPKILTQPDANPQELIADALKQFLSRNEVHKDRIAVSVSGQSGLARFIKLPPVEAKKIPDIVRYEAKQQIPFDLNDVIWDFQRMGGGAETSGFVLETEIGLFAMKRDAVFRALAPFVAAGIEVDIVQLAPLALYNFVVFDQLRDLPAAEDYDEDHQPESVVVVSLGTDATDLVVTNGFRVWQRNVPLGGSHFTKSLTKEMKLTFAKAEHLKRNATTAQDPKAVFQAMRPVFNDMQTELQRSLGFFTNLDRKATIGRVVAMGNAFKLPGLRKYLEQSLGFKIDRIETFRGLVGPEVLATPAFKENILSFGVCYGLCLQGLGMAGLRTNLLPREITRDRIVRQKKPWAVVAAALTLLACTVSYTAYSMQYGSVKESTWQAAESKAKEISTRSGSLKSQRDEALKKFQETDGIGKHLVNQLQGRNRWLELLAGLDKCFPFDKHPMETTRDPEKLSVALMKRDQLFVTNIDSQQMEDVSKWFAAVKGDYFPFPDMPGAPPLSEAAAASGGGTSSVAAPAAASSAGTASAATGEGPTGPGIIVQVYGRHYHNNSGSDEGHEFVLGRLVKKLASPEMVALGVSYPVLIKPEKIAWTDIPIPEPKLHGDSGTSEGHGGHGQPSTSGMGLGTGGTNSGVAADKKPLRVKQFIFRVQFVWQPKAPAEQQTQVAEGTSPTKPKP